MNAQSLLVKCITLLYRESQLTVKTENSNEVVRSILEEIKVNEFALGANTERDVLIGLRDLALEMVSNPYDYQYDPDVLLQRIKIITLHEERLYETIASGIKDELSESVLKRTIVNISRALSNYFKEQKILSTLNKATYSFKHDRTKIKDVNEFLLTLTTELESLQTNSTIKDPSVVDEIDIGDIDSVVKVVKRIKDNESGDGMLVTGWQALNRMLQGGFRRGEFWMIAALQHKYKTGFTLSLFAQIAMHNKPYMLDIKKKPLLLRISFEDDITNNLQFMYQYLKFNETNTLPNIKHVDDQEMSSYINSQLGVNGYTVKFMRVDPSGWTYKHITNKIIELESLGYETHMLMVDYLSMIPTTGCVNSGPTGTDLRDMFRRIRNFCSPY